MKSWLVSIALGALVACSNAPPKPAAHSTASVTGSGSSTTDTASLVQPTTGGSASGSGSATGPTRYIDPKPTAVAGDPPEPVAPQIECDIRREVHCHAVAGVLTAMQPSPFELCAKTAPAMSSSLVPDMTAHFSAAETRAARKREPSACCYVEFTTMACD
jgi:hypothetical protein